MKNSLTPARKALSVALGLAAVAALLALVPAIGAWAGSAIAALVGALNDTFVEAKNFGLVALAIAVGSTWLVLELCLPRESTFARPRTDGPGLAGPTTADRLKLGVGAAAAVCWALLLVQSFPLVRLAGQSPALIVLLGLGVLLTARPVARMAEHAARQPDPFSTQAPLSREGTRAYARPEALVALVAVPLSIGPLVDVR